MSYTTQQTSAQCSNCNFTFKTLSEARSVDLETRLRSNNGSSSLETTQITELLSDVKADEARCESEISRLHSVIISLENNRLELQGRAEAYKSLQAPIRRLPVETLTHIFSFCMNHTGFEKAPTALVLGSVCSYWHSIVVSNPTLWSTISLECSRSMDLLNVSLQRSGQLPLTLDVCPPGDMERPAMERLLQHSSRWLSASLYLADDETIRGLFRTLDGNAPLLEYLHLDIEDDAEDRDHVILRSLPRLRTLSVKTVTAAMVFPWQQLVHLRLEYVVITELRRALQLCTSLETADVKNAFSAVGQHLNPTISNLRTFSVDTDETAEVLPALFAVVTFPLVENLEISTDPDLSDCWPELRDVLSSFLSRSSSRLTSITLSHIIIPPVDLLALLRALPLLMHLSVLETDGSLYYNVVAPPHTLGDIVFQSLNTHSTGSFDSSRTSLLPNLRTITFHAHGESDLSDKYFVDMVKSRWSPLETRSDRRGVACLHSVELRVIGRSFDMAKFEPLRHLARAGMKVAIHDAGGMLH